MEEAYRDWDETKRAVSFDLWAKRKFGVEIVLPDLDVDQGIKEFGSSHDEDDSPCDFRPVLSVDGLIEKCTICGDEREIQDE